ncbi:unnamed protein product, partial [Heterotrigona itama]
FEYSSIRSIEWFLFNWWKGIQLDLVAKTTTGCDRGGAEVRQVGTRESGVELINSCHGTKRAARYFRNELIAQVNSLGSSVNHPVYIYETEAATTIDLILIGRFFRDDRTLNEAVKRRNPRVDT